MRRKLERNEELRKWRWRYEQRAKEGKSRLLDEFCEQYGFSRKHAMKLLGESLPEGESAPRLGRYANMNR